MNLFDRIAASFRHAPVELRGPTGALATTQPLYRQVAIHQIFDWLAGVPDPDEVLRRTGRSRGDLRQLLRDAEVSQALDTRREAVLATPWSFDPWTTRASIFVADELTPHMPQLISAAWDAVTYGYSVIETVYARRGARIGIGAVHAPPFEWFRPLPDRSIRYFPMTGEGGMDGIECDPVKFTLSSRNATDANPYGDSLLSVLYWPVTWRLQGWKLWLEFLESFGSPIVIGKVADYNKFIEAMAAQGVARAVGWQASDNSEAISTISASTPGEFERLENALTKTIQKVVLGQTLTSDVGPTGSFAAAKVHDNVRGDKRRADIRIVIAAIQMIVDNVWMLNKFPGDAPRFSMQDETGLERERTDRDAILASFGIRFTKDYFLNRYDLEDGDFDIAEPPATPPVAPGGIKPRETVKQSAQSSPPKFTPQQEVIERGIARVVGSAPMPITLAQLRGVIVGAADEGDLEARLALLIDKQDPEYESLLGRAQYVAHVLGYVHATETPAAP